MMTPSQPQILQQNSDNSRQVKDSIYCLSDFPYIFLF